MGTLKCDLTKASDMVSNEKEGFSTHPTTPRAPNTPPKQK